MPRYVVSAPPRELDEPGALRTEGTPMPVSPSAALSRRHLLLAGAVVSATRPGLARAGAPPDREPRDSAQLLVDARAAIDLDGLAVR